MLEKERVTKISIQIYGFFKSAQNKVEINSENIIINPPIVGVPAFARWDWGPSSRIDCENCILVSRLIINGPSNIDKSNAVNVPPIVLTVR